MHGGSEHLMTSPPKVQPPPTHHETATGNGSSDAPQEDQRNVARSNGATDLPVTIDLTSSVQENNHSSVATPLDVIREFQHQGHSLRFSASDVAAIAGFHPYKNLPKLFLMDHVYQGRRGQMLLRHDASLLNLRLVSDDEALINLAKKAGAQAAKALSSAFQVKSGEKKLQTTKAAEGLKQKVLAEAAKTNKLSVQELKQLQQGTQDLVNTGFGTTWEDSALDQYERKCGWEVQERNVEVRTWPFVKVEGSDGVETVAPLCSAFSYNQVVQRDGNDDVEKDEQASNVARKELKDIMMKPHFSIRGAVDGIRDELQPNDGQLVGSPSQESWIMKRIIVECKHRMNRIQPSPPLYEQIQTTAYCLMYEVEEADIVQVLRRPSLNKAETSSLNAQLHTASQRRSPPASPTKIKDFFSPSKKQKTEPERTAEVPLFNAAETQGADSKQMRLGTGDNVTPTDESHKTEHALEICVSRVTLDDPILRHRHNWDSVVLPRLRAWADSVYQVRANDALRYEMLSAFSESEFHPEEAWKLLFSTCTWLENADTSFRRSKF